jgi:hypothetical protein
MEQTAIAAPKLGVTALSNSPTKVVETTKNPARRPGFFAKFELSYAPSLLTRNARRETFRDAVLLCMTPLAAARISSG